jgi:uncharacterized protein YqgV (UPF0045/DUF77 family)
MSLFVHPENQQLLWNIVNSNVYVNQFFVTNPTVKKEEWFKQMIEYFYKKLDQKEITYDELNVLNKDALTYMVQNIHTSSPAFSPSVRNIEPQFQAPTSYPNNNIETPPIVANTREQQYTNDFKSREQEYTSMIEKKVPTDIDFSEKIDEEPIQNIDELLQQQMKERDSYLQQYNGPPINPTNDVSPIKIDKTTNVILETDTLQPSNDKKVSWQEDKVSNVIDRTLDVLQTDDHIDSPQQTIHPELTILQNQMNTLIEQVNQLRSIIVLHNQQTVPLKNKVDIVKEKIAEVGNRSNPALTPIVENEVLLETVESDSE